ncbi:MAG: hypothetical protein R2851_05350 [Caldilineaceae bacterium]
MGSIAWLLWQRRRVEIRSWSAGEKLGAKACHPSFTITIIDELELQVKNLVHHCGAHEWR